MAKTLVALKFTTLLSLVVFLLLGLHFQSATSFEYEKNKDNEEYTLDSAFTSNVTRRSRFLSSAVKKGAQCDAKKKTHVCNGVSADKGVTLLYCCKKRCQNVLSNRNNSGRCGCMCRLNERCCGGVCSDVLRSKSNCGKCNKKCRKGVKCEYGYCGYA